MNFSILKTIGFLSILQLILTACSSTRIITPPSKEELTEIIEIVNEDDLEDLDKEKNPAKYWSAHYLLAKKELDNSNYPKACDNFKKILPDKSFPLIQLVEIKFHTYCSSSKEDFLYFWKTNNHSIHPYLEQTYSKLFLERTKQENLYELSSLLTVIAANYQKSRLEKERYYLDALELAKKSNDELLLQKSEEILYEYSPRLRKNYKTDELYSAGRDFEKHRKFKEARILYKKLLNDQKSNIKQKIMAYHRIRLSHKLERNRKEYIKFTKKMVAWLKSKEQTSYIKREYNKTRIKLARGLWTVGEIEEGKKILIKLSKFSSLSSEQKIETLWVLAGMYLEQKDFITAVNYLEQAIKINPIKKDIKQKIIWAIGWNYYQLKFFNQTLNVFNNYIEESDENEDLFINKLKFWNSKAYLQLKQEDKAKEIWRELYEKKTPDYYVILAQIYLGIPFEPIKYKRNENNKVNEPTLEWLLALSENELAREYLIYKKKTIKTEREKIDYLRYFSKSELYLEAIKMFYSLKESSRETISKESLFYLFPLPYVQKFNHYATKNDIDAAIIYAIARQESAFDPFARSHADAFGLLQLTPEKAKELSLKTKKFFKDHNSLYDIDLNLFFGSYLLNELKTKHLKNFTHFVASYNAGSGAVNRWKKTRHRDDPIEFIEMIPYEETQNYVKLVFRNFITYFRLLGREGIIKKDFFLKSETTL